MPQVHTHSALHQGLRHSPAQERVDWRQVGVDGCRLCVCHGRKAQHPPLKQHDVHGGSGCGPGGGVRAVALPAVRRLVIPACMHGWGRRGQEGAGGRGSLERRHSIEHQHKQHGPQPQHVNRPAAQKGSRRRQAALNSTLPAACLLLHQRTWGAAQCCRAWWRRAARAACLCPAPCHATQRCPASAAAGCPGAPPPLQQGQAGRWQVKRHLLIR